MNPDRARNLLLTTDYPIDTVVGRVTGSNVVPQATSMSDFTPVIIPHNLGYAPLCIGTWSEQASFDAYYKFGSSPRFFNPFFQFWDNRIIAVVESSTTDISLMLLNWDTTRTIYWRVSMIAPSNVTDSPIPSSAERQSLYINTDLNLMKVYDQGFVSQTLPGSGLITRTIPHNLGIVPMAFAWSEAGGTIRRSGEENAIGVTGVATAVRVDNTNLYIDFDSWLYSSVGLHYRIYLD